MVTSGAVAEHKTAVPKAASKPAPESPRDVPSPATEDALEPSDQVRSSRCRISMPSYGGDETSKPASEKAWPASQEAFVMHQSL